MSLDALLKAVAALPPQDISELDDVGVPASAAVGDEAGDQAPSIIAADEPGVDVTVEAGGVDVDPHAVPTPVEAGVAIEVLPPEQFSAAPIVPADADQSADISTAAEAVASVEMAPPTAEETVSPVDVSLDAALGDIPKRDIANETVEPAIQTDEQKESARKAAAEALGADPSMASSAAPAASSSSETTTSVAEATQEAAPPAAEQSADEKAAPAVEEAFVFDAKEAAEMGLPADVVRMIAALPAAQARQFVEGLRAERGAAGTAAREEADRRRPRAGGGGGGFSLFGGLGSALGAAMRRPKGKADPATLLSPDNIRSRIEELRRTEILDQAARVSRSHAGMTDASKAFNAALLATDAGKAFESKVDELAAAHPEIDRRKIMQMSMNGTLGSAIGSDPLRPLVGEAFKSEPVRKAWNDMERHADGIEKHGKVMLERMKAFEEHFPKSVDTERLNKVVESAMEGIEKGFDEAIAQSPEAKRAWKDRLEALAKQVREFVERLLAKLGFGPR
ncbi:hypothetical protein ACVIGB_000058 [Bradyrhizobium sp. USDA 4341]